MKLLKKILITGEIKALTGLMIGGSNISMSIGGTDKVVIRNPFTKEPYIPGSSIKGKMRSLTEISYGYIMGEAKDKGVGFYGDNNPLLITAQLFGTARGNKDL